MLGLVLTGGGARGAYQAGVLKRLSEQPALRDRPSPFAIIAGGSAGAINGALLAARGERFADAANGLATVWSNLRSEQVFRTTRRARLARATLARDFCSAGRSIHGHPRLPTPAARIADSDTFPARASPTDPARDS
jgi:NTE family protein